MSSPRSDLNPVLRDPDTTFHMVAPRPPGPLMTDEHDGTVNDALVGTSPTAHILDQINPSTIPYNLNNDALVKDLAHYIGVGHQLRRRHLDACTTSSRTSTPDSRRTSRSSRKATTSCRT